MMFLAAIGWPEALMILAAVMLLFGARKIPDVARSLGASINEFKRGMKDGVSDDASKEGEKDKKV
jgi:sec-independent protein translocase protein TatA